MHETIRGGRSFFAPPAEVHDDILSVTGLARIFRRHLPDGTVICKELRGAEAMQRFAHEKRILERLAHVDGVARLVEGEFPPRTLVMKDVQARPATGGRGDRLELPELLRLSHDLAEILAALHRAGVIHRNLNPETVLISGEDNHPQIIDFSLSTTFAEDRPAFVHHREIAGKLPYLAPEQTGRTGRPVDQRADLYALGATIYEFATGVPPFEGTDTLQLLHDILTVIPVPPGELEPKVPGPLSGIIMRLLEKEPDNRYQTAEGVMHDLSLVSAALKRGEECDLVLGERDFPLRLSPPSRLIGREGAVASIEKAFSSAMEGKERLLLIAGPPGVGKTALLNELRPQVAARRGFFVYGKFDQHRRDLDSDAVYQALCSLGRLLLAEPEAELELLRQRMLHALGSNAGIMANVPEFSLLLGVSASHHEKDPRLAEVRAQQAALDLLRAVASAERPLVMLLDDLQWGTSTPIGLLDAVLQDREAQGLLLVGTYRPEEIGAGHPLAMLHSRWEDLGIPAPVLPLGHLDEQHVAVLLRQMLRLGDEEGASLAREVCARTGGNPFETVEFVNALRCEGVLVPGAEGWSWDAAAIRRHIGRDDVTHLIACRIDRLPRESAVLLDVMACLGGIVDLPLLEAAAQLSADALEERLTAPLEDGLLVLDQGGGVRFRHDRVQQAAHDRLDPEHLCRLHLELGRRLARHPAFGGVAAEQYLAVVDLITERAEVERVVSLFRNAAERERGINLPLIERYLAAAVTLLERTGGGDAEFLIPLETERHSALYGLGRLEEADSLFESISRHCATRDPLELVDAACIHINSLANRRLFREAVSTGLALLGRLGIAVPDEKDGSWIEAGLDELYRWVAQDGVEEDLLRPEPEDPRVHAAGRILCRLGFPSFCVAPVICVWLTLECRRLWSTHGPCAAIMDNLGAAVTQTITLRQDYRTGYAVARRVLAVGKTRGYEPETSRVLQLFLHFGRHWFEPFEESLRLAHLAREGLLRGGDSQYVGLSYFTTLVTLLDCAPGLEAVQGEAEIALSYGTRTGNELVYDNCLPYCQLVAALTLPVEGAGDGGAGDPFGEEPPRNPTAEPVFHILRGLAAAVMGDGVTLAQSSARAVELVSRLSGMYSAALAYLLRGVALAHAAAAATPDDRPALLAECDKSRDWLARRAADCAHNFLHLVHFLDGERGWSAGEPWQAAQAFDAALGAVGSVQRPWHRALITERAALFHLSHGMKEAGRRLMLEAYSLYARWGAVAKVRQLESRYSWVKGEQGAALPMEAHGHEQGPAPKVVSGDDVDLLAVLRASQALSSETSLARLYGHVVELLSAMTGATAVALVLRKEESQSWFILPTAPEEAEWQEIGEPFPAALLPNSVLRYVIRSLEPLIVEDAVRDDRFRRDPYLASCDRCSIVAAPILSHGHPRAILILENRLSRGAFAADCLDVVKLLVGQLAVSLENALVYGRLEERVAERTRELREAQSEIVATARRAGMAEIATNVLHNVGNVLNSVNVSAGVLSNALEGSKASGLARAVQLMNEHTADLGAFFTADDRGVRLPSYMERLSVAIAQEQRGMVEELSRLKKSVEHIKEIVATQQSYAGSSSMMESAPISEVLEDALRMNEGALARHRVTVVKEFCEAPPIPLDKARVLQILINLISNAKYAMDAPCAGNVMTLRTRVEGGRLLIEVSDEGEGIAPENLARIFNHGFTTRKGGHGFGLHSSAIAAKEMGGTLTAASDGVGKGATFTLQLPL